MRNEPVRTLTAPVFTLPDANVDTDQIIPARFLTTTERGALGEACFHDWRFHMDGSKTGHRLNALAPGQPHILVAGHNFGCGSSREHAPWALKDFGFQAVVTTRAADIFRSNALKNALVVCEIDEASHAALMDRDGLEMTIDVAAGEIIAGNIKARFTLEPFARTCLIEGVDPLGYILAQDEAIRRFEAGRAA
ncbi:3-isopropylmalate dehydratase small subunit [Alkalicaulis satelles]|uniref:3-isopropylmalate dehydratase n=1 Tax=Alkalicaulis satelles TaxID=2609175 RepID=A0A5M6Z8P9_9PROT|nr:3-isopropylmalate dehydratase small subunit [Alkalicaulis satelles]KAA5801013.1 3-isopropylmalate dehydratase small subunit [Alkalicaulis satelles]